MIHDMGDIGINYWGQYKPIHRSPIRHYYIIRNTLYLVRLTYVPIRWKLVELLKTFRRIMAYLVFSSDRLASVRLIFLGIFDGLCGRLGAFSNLHLNSVDK
jgi:rhamnosyltransferase